MKMTMPPQWCVIADRDSDTHDALCDAVLDDSGYLLVNDVLYEAITWTPTGPSAWRWVLRRCDAARA